MHLDSGLIESVVFTQSLGSFPIGEVFVVKVLEGFSLAGSVVETTAGRVNVRLELGQSPDESLPVDQGVRVVAAELRDGREINTAGEALAKVLLAAGDLVLRARELFLKVLLLSHDVGKVALSLLFGPATLVEEGLVAELKAWHGGCGFL